MLRGFRVNLTYPHRHAERRSMSNTPLGTLVLFVAMIGVVPEYAPRTGEITRHAEMQDADQNKPAKPDAASQPDASRPRSFLLDSAKKPRIAISWPCSDGTTTRLEAEREYQAPKQATPIGKNLSAYVALGGNRGDLGYGTPGSVDVRVGFYTIDPRQPMFEGIGANAFVTIEFRGITFNQPARARPITTLHHLTFQGNDRVLGCAGDPGLLATYNTMNPAEEMRGRLNKRNSRKGVLSDSAGTGEGRVKIEYTTDAAGAVSMKAIIPYHLFKHADDPWLTSNPGDFVEPMHFHIEFECEPASGVSTGDAATPAPEPIKPPAKPEE